MARTTLDFSSTFQRPNPTAIIMPSPSLPFFSHNHHHYPLKAPTPSFIRNIIIIIIHQPFPHAHHHHHHLHHHSKQAQEEDDEHNQGTKLAATAASLMRIIITKSYFPT
uniref:Uncharacterized protein n=1 Tax=Cajanus cajan TaxID=3821 RepID=A0A151QT83_CAJCA|nr:hypothetical protein KK1_045662 [Cajanus cajan]